MGAIISYSGKERVKRKRRDSPSPFELLPLEIKEMILKKAIEDTLDFHQFKKFWSLKRVNKEFYHILNSNLIRRFSVKFPCWILFSQCHIDNVTRMKVYFPNNSTKQYRNFEIVLDDCHASYSQFEKKELEIDWKDVPGYFRDQPLKIDFVVIEPYGSTTHMIPAIKELANQTSEKLDVQCKFLHLDQVEQLYSGIYNHTNHLGFQREEFRQTILNELKDVVEAGKINIAFQSEY